ncbi:unnamed protein product [Bursaphelenchus xylophilus]|uniref:(pine wood nematode) hypothetical protein n=1 Tax=Bursaphelenchus xylophilus TaxID=6326 RepID=A0A1I7RR05_BURXY|nr:unnamed protein product [Bursaphelenchus xylophilus]CAG9130780.1 unnamed protein product [Bursaphelenchus xylophilus]
MNNNFYTYGKENICSGELLFPAKRSSSHGRKTKGPSTSTKINECPPFIPSLAINRDIATTFSTTSSVSDDEVEKRHRSKRACPGRTVYSTSDITSDSSQFSHHQFERNFNYPCDSSDEYDDRLDAVSPVQLDLQPDVTDESDLPPPLELIPGRYYASGPSSPQMMPNRPVREPKKQKSTEPVSIFDNNFDRFNRPEEYNLPGGLAKMLGCHGILFLKFYVDVIQGTIEVVVDKGAFFLNRYDEVFSKVRVEIHQNPNFNSSNRKRGRKDRNFPCYESHVVEGHNPRYKLKFPIELTESNFENHDKLGISVFTRDREDEDGRWVGSRLGQMAFSIRKLYLKGRDAARGHRHRSSKMKLRPVLNGGYFLLGPEKGESTTMSQDKILTNKFYDVGGGNSMFSTSSSTYSASPVKMMGEDICRRPLMKEARGSASTSTLADPRRHSLQINTKSRNNNIRSLAGSSRVPQYVPAMMQQSAALPLECIGMAPRKKVSLPVRAISQDQQFKKKKENLDTMNLSSSSNSFSSTGAEYKSRHRHTLPYLMTTTDTSDFSQAPTLPVPGCSADQEINYGMLYADTAPTHHVPPQRPVKESKSVDLPRKTLSTQPSVSVRRVASFTYSNDSVSDKNNKRIQPSGNSTKFKLPTTISKIGNFLRNRVERVDLTLSTNSLCPTSDEVRSWQDSFESLLNNKVGLEMFRQFVIGEVSSENLDFYLDVEEYKKCKNKAKLNQKSQAIFDAYFRKDAPREINLDAETKGLTLNAIDQGLNPETYNLAQNKILQLMTKDSYRRFLQSKLYLDLLNATTPPPSASLPASSPSPRTSPSPLEDPSSGKASPVPSLPSRRHTGLPNDPSVPTITE